jgi:hypothetical protein
MTLVPSTATVICPTCKNFSACANSNTRTKVSCSSALFSRRKVQIVSWSGWVSAQIIRTGTLSELACSMRLELKSPVA